MCVKLTCLDLYMEVERPGVDRCKIKLRTIRTRDENTIRPILAHIDTTDNTILVSKIVCRDEDNAKFTTLKGELFICCSLVFLLLRVFIVFVCECYFCYNCIVSIRVCHAVINQLTYLLTYACC